MRYKFHNWLVHRIVFDNVSKALSLYGKGRLLDIGCGTKPYKDLIAPIVNEHIGLDHHETLHDKSDIDLFGTAYRIPKGNASFDCALCTAVLEHLEEPEAALRECYRVLKPNGVAIYSVPFIWHLHEEPRDFFRFSKYGLKYLFEKVGFEILELKALSGFWITFGQLFVYNIYRFHRGPLRFVPIIPLVALVIQGLSYLLDRVDRTEQWTWMYLVVAKKSK
jgi:SAM-dependent methyltransferase